MNELKTLKDIINYAAETYGEQAALRYKVKKEIKDKNYLELKADSMAVSRMLDAFGLKGKHIALIGTTSYAWISVFFGITNSGSVAVPLDAQLPAFAICDLLNRADAEMFVYDEIRADLVSEVKKNCPKVTKIVSLQASEEKDGILSLSKLIAEYSGEFDTEIDPDQICTLLFTSGTTGISKGVMLSHRGMTDNAIVQDMKIPVGSRSLTVLPINHVYCLTVDVVEGIYIGMTICINDSIMHVQKNIKLFQPYIMLLVPMIIESIGAKLKAIDPALPKAAVAKEVFGENLKLISSGGAYLDPEYVKLFAEYGVTIIQGYGMTECSPVISSNLPWANKVGSVGVLMPNCEGKIVDNEIWVRGSSVMKGYYKMPKETEETLTEDGWLKTGDLGYIDEDNYVYITGRKKNLIILANGENVSPEELENELSRSDLVKEVLVRDNNHVIEAEIFPDMEYAQAQGIEDVKGNLQQLLDNLNKDMPVYKRIHSLVVRDTEFEKTVSKKIKRF